jgi:DNA (cytosine-5)-methyltransferase 1
MSKKINVLDIFSGCWGLTEWFLKENYSFIGHIEMDKYACESLKTRILFDYLNKKWKLEDYKNYLKKAWEININKKNSFSKNILERNKLIKKYNLDSEINKVYNTEISDKTYPELLSKLKDNLWNNKLDILIGWPPCQTYSQIWRARVWEKICQDPRNFLYLQYVKFLKDLQPEMFVFENVIWLRTAWKWKYLKDIKKAINDAWYELETDDKVVKQYMPNYWIPQNRTRLILIWWKKGSKIINKYPSFKKNENYNYIVNDFLDDLPKIKEWWWSEIMKYSQDNEILEKLWIRNKNIDFVISH